MVLSCAVQSTLSKVSENLLLNILMKHLCKANSDGKDRGSWLNEVENR